MNFALLGYILSVIGIIYSLLAFGVTMYNFAKLPIYLQELAEIRLGKETLILIVSIAYIVTYHLS